MSNELKAGDTVRCIDATDAQDRIEEGYHYFVDSVGPCRLITLGGHAGMFREERFELIFRPLDVDPPAVPVGTPPKPATDLDGILDERGSRYGEFTDNAEIAQRLKEVLCDGLNHYRLDADQKEALDQIATKISRIVTGDVTYVDNWDDIAGYAQCVARRMRAEA
jgi:hypothetical protein